MTGTRFTNLFVPLLITIVMSVGLFVQPLKAEPTPTINYQGKLTNASGVAVPNGTYNMRFYLYNTTLSAAEIRQLYNQVVSNFVSARSQPTETALLRVP